MRISVQGSGTKRSQRSVERNNFVNLPQIILVGTESVSEPNLKLILGNAYLPDRCDCIHLGHLAPYSCNLQTDMCAFLNRRALIVRELGRRCVTVEA